MSERDVETIYTEDVSSGMGHIRLVVNGAVLTDERDNLDDAGEYRTITVSEFLAKPRRLLCKRCVPVEPDSDVVTDDWTDAPIDPSPAVDQ